MKPTPELRFLARRAAGKPGQPVGTVRILQQLWVSDDGQRREWRDVPLATETAKLVTA